MSVPFRDAENPDGFVIEQFGPGYVESSTLHLRVGDVVQDGVFPWGGRFGKVALVEDGTVVLQAQNCDCWTMRQPVRAWRMSDSAVFTKIGDAPTRPRQGADHARIMAEFEADGDRSERLLNSARVALFAVTSCPRLPDEKTYEHALRAMGRPHRTRAPRRTIRLMRQRADDAYAAAIAAAKHEIAER